MWQFSWLFSLIPDSWLELITYSMVAVGVILYIASKLVGWLPFIKTYKLPIELVGVILYGVGAFYAGGYGVERMWRERVAVMEQQVKEAEAKSAQVVVKIETKVVTKIKRVVEVREVIKREIEIQKEIINAGCEINDAAIQMYNRAVTNPEEIK